MNEARYREISDANRANFEVVLLIVVSKKGKTGISNLAFRSMLANYQIMSDTAHVEDVNFKRGSWLERSSKLGRPSTATFLQTRVPYL